MASRDFISSLPDEILGQILSLVPTKISASTPLLSKRWRHVVPPSDELDFDDSMLWYPDRNENEARRRRPGRSVRFHNFVNNRMGLYSSNPPPPIKKFSLKCDSESDFFCVNHWILTALERGCLELNLDLGVPIKPESFMSNTLVKLTISNTGFTFRGCLPGGDVFFPALKTLSLVSTIFSNWPVFNCFIHGCPALEEIFICDRTWYLSSPSVKRATITSDLNGVLYSTNKLMTPSLVYLDYSCYIAPEVDHHVVSDSLVEARLDLRLYKPGIYRDVTRLMKGMNNLKTLHLSPDSLEVLFYCCYSMPVFHNLLNLSIESNKNKGWHVMPLIIHNSPNLQTLVIKGLVHKVNSSCGDACACIPMKKKEMVCCLSRCGIKVLKISGYKGSLIELKQMRRFLGKLEYLETVKVGVEEDSRNHQNLRANLMALRTVSSKCEIQIV